MRLTNDFCRLTNYQINEQQVENFVEIDKSIVEVGDSCAFGIDIEYRLSSSTNIKNEVQIDKRNDNSKIKNNKVNINTSQLLLRIQYIFSKIPGFISQNLLQILKFLSTTRFYKLEGFIQKKTGISKCIIDYKGLQQLARIAYLNRL